MRETARIRELRRSGRWASLVALLLLSGCGDYDPEPAASGGSTTTGGLSPGGGSGGSGQTAVGGSTSAAAGGSGTGGSAPSVPMVEADCNDVTACGGDVAGTWIVAGSCLPVSGMADMTGFGLNCTRAPVTGMLEVTGTWSANADGTFMDQTITAGESQIDLPSSCLNVSGTTTTCDRVGSALPALGYASVECVDAASGGGCTCAATTRQNGGLATVALGAPQSGMYMTAASVLTTTANSSNTYDYCVQGNTLVVTPQTVGRTGTLTGTIVLVKQAQ